MECEWRFADSEPTGRRREKVKEGEFDTVAEKIGSWEGGG